MNNIEMVKILAVLRANYPNARIDDAEAMVKTWLMTLGEFNVREVEESAKLHMKISKFFPTPAELREKIVRSKILVDTPSIPRLASPKKKIPDGMTEDEYLDSVITSQIDLETEMHTTERRKQMNNIILSGRIAYDIEVKATKDGKKFLFTRIAVNRNDTNRTTDFFNVKAWERTAEFIEKYFHKGDPIVLVGELRNESYTKLDGTKVESSFVSVTKVEFVPRSTRSEVSTAAESKPSTETPAPEIPEPESPLPFEI